MRRGPPPIVQILSGGDRRSIGRANAVTIRVLSAPSTFPELFAALSADDPVVRVRAADAVEKVSVVHPAWLVPYKNALLTLAQSVDKEVRWHVAQMLPRLRWSPGEHPQVYAVLTAFLGDESGIVKTFAMQALADMTAQVPAWRPAVLRTIRRCVRQGTPAMRARGRKLLPLLTSAPGRSGAIG